MESMFSQSQAAWASPELSYEERMLVQPEEESPASPTWDRMEPWLHRLPAREQDFVRLYYKDGLRQEQISAMFGCTQAGVSYRLAKARKRLQFLQVCPALTKDDFDLALLWEDPVNVELAFRCYFTTCQSLVALELGMSQGQVRGRYWAVVSRIRRRMAEAAAETAFIARRMRDMSRSSEEVRRAEEQAERAAADSPLRPFLKALLLVASHWNVMNEVHFPWMDERASAVIITVEDATRRRVRRKK